LGFKKSGGLAPTRRKEKKIKKPLTCTASRVFFILLFSSLFVEFVQHLFFIILFSSPKELKNESKGKEGLAYRRL
jgi:hypothetical protein